MTVAIHGDIDAATAAAARAMLDGAIAEHPSAIVRVDIAEVTHVDSTGVGMFVAVQRRASTSGGDLKLIRPPPQVRGLLKLTGLDSLLLGPNDEAET